MIRTNSEKFGELIGISDSTRLFQFFRIISFIAEFGRIVLAKCMVKLCNYLLRLIIAVFNPIFNIDSPFEMNNPGFAAWKSTLHTFLCTIRSPEGIINGGIFFSMNRMSNLLSLYLLSIYRGTNNDAERCDQRMREAECLSVFSRYFEYLYTSH